MALSTKDTKPDKHKEKEKEDPNYYPGTTEGVKPGGESFEQVLVKKHEKKEEDEDK